MWSSVFIVKLETIGIKTSFITQCSKNLSESTAHVFSLLKLRAVINLHVLLYGKEYQNREDAISVASECAANTLLDKPGERRSI